MANFYQQSEIPAHLLEFFVPAEIGKEKTPDQFVAALVAVFHEVRRVLKDDGCAWINMGDSYGKGKQLLGIPWRLAFALQDDGWILRQEIIWAKPNPMPESVTDRCTKSHESIFLLAKSEKYYFDAGAIKEASTGRTNFGDMNRIGRVNAGGDWQSKGKGGKNAFRGQGHQRDSDNGSANHEGRDMQDVGASETRNKRSVWTVATTPYAGAHFATFPPALIEPCILAGAPAGGVVLDPFGGSGTTAQVAQSLGRNWILCELNAAYRPLIEDRTAQPSFEFTEAA